MLCLKKVYSDNLLQLALILSLLKVDPEYYLGFGPRSWGYGSLESGNTTSWFVDSPHILRSQQLHPKSLDNVLLNYERQVFEDLNSLGRYNRIGTNIHNSNITAYLLNIGDSVVPTNSEASEDSEASSTSPQNDTRDDSDNLWSEVVSPLADVAEAISTAELTQEDMDLIEVLWKQDVDLGFSLAEAENNPTDDGRKSSADSPETSSANIYLSDIKLTEKPVIPTNSTLPSRSSSNIDDDVEKLKALEALKSEDVAEPGDVLGDPWAGLSYTVDTETGEYVLKGGLGDALPVADSDTSLPPLDLPLPLPEFLLEELELCGLDEDCPQEAANPKDVERPEDSPSEDSGGSSSGSVSGAGGGSASAEGIKDPLDSDEELEIFSDMIQTAQFHPSHPRPFHQSHMPFVRTMSMEQRWQDLANLLSLPPGDAANAAAAAAGMNANAAVHHAHAAAFSHHAHAHAAHHAAHHAAALHNYSTHGHPHPHHTPHPMSYTSDARGVLLHNASLAPPMGDLNVTSPYNNIAGAGTNLGNAVATSMNLTNSSEPMGDAGSTPHYKMESSHDMMYYPNSSSEIGNTTDGFLSSILNDEDLQLMDMAMSEGMYTMRMLDGGGSPASGNGRDLATAVDRGADASSDSAVSSMGSERVPSLSDGEWCDAASDSGHTTGDHYPLEYHAGNAYCSKYRPYDYSYSTRQHTSLVGSDVSRRVPTVAQKKHQMFGKRFFQEQGANALTQPTTSVKYEYPEPSSANTYGTPSTNPMLDDSSVAKPPELKYSCTMEFGRHVHSGRSALEHVQHNHTYHLPAESTGAMQRPVSRDKLKGRKSEDEPHLTRDEKRARALNVPIAVDDIINLPMDEFNERLSKYDLTEPQLSLIRDIRRRGKNKVAAQNCRKRKLDQILSLADEVKDMRDRKNRLINERDFIVAERQRVKEKFAQLYRHVFQNLRDADGNPYSSTLYSLQQSADGSVLVVPRANASMIPPEQKDQHNNQKE